MKQHSVLAILFSSAASFALSALPNGSWTGKGQYRAESGEKGAYDEKLTIKDNVATSEITVKGKTYTYVMAYKFKPNDFVAVAIEDKLKAETRQGRGYCGSVWCHVQDDSGKFEMTTVYFEDGVYELGSDSEDGKMGWFESALKTVK